MARAARLVKAIASSRDCRDTLLPQIVEPRSLWRDLHLGGVAANLLFSRESMSASGLIGGGRSSVGSTPRSSVGSTPRSSVASLTSQLWSPRGSTPLGNTPRRPKSHGAPRVLSTNRLKLEIVV